MAKTSAQRQAQYRANRPYSGNDGNGERRLNLWLDTGAALALERLARRYCVTKRLIIERLLQTEDERVLSGIDLDSSEWHAYFHAPDSAPLRSNEFQKQHKEIIEKEKNVDPS